MIKKYTTASGSIYVIDFVHKTWTRIRGEEAAEIRTNEGRFDQFDIAYDGSIILVCPPFIPGTSIPRYIHSTPIISEDIIVGE